MADTLGLLVAGALGVALGVVFFAGLWWTVRAVPASRHPGLLVFASFLVRSATVVFGLALLAGDLSLLAVGVAGLMVARWGLLRRGRADLVPKGA
jgi:F1F0 ATPase subunit 2